MAVADGSVPARRPARQGTLARLAEAAVPIRICILAAFVLLLVFAPVNAAVLGEFWFFAPIGVFGAIIANATGTGGGVVFVPIFNAISDGAIELSAAARAVGNISDSTIAMSFLIQSFGMSMGSTVWLVRLGTGRTVPSDERCDEPTTLSLLFTAVVTAVPALLLTQWFVRLDPATVLTLFKLFSLALGVSLLAVTLKHDRFAPARHTRMATRGDLRAVAAIGIVGGVVTALFSVGVGEFLAVYLILRKYPIHTAVGLAVIVSALCVLSGVWFHIASGAIIYEIVLWTIPGALLGGAIAGKVASSLGAQKLKLFASLWIVASSLYLLLT